ncbi:hypothetical protein FYZ48_07155 [Gimesia chilikensis]|uniref:hypothetical protein n=1 Tax=Gimesia chilikensis TaxID=2605989 RepID=UPI0011EC4BE8|nr:hypothetical protein [Gimesia chilikensis]KAA0139705.1 hypothetical protein FYZ48_07155 [Gimesia chilikensis]
MNYSLYDQIIDAMYELAYDPIKKRFPFRKEVNRQRNDLSMAEVFRRLEKQYPTTEIIAAVKWVLNDAGNLFFMKRETALSIELLQSIRILFCLHLLAELEQPVLSFDEFFDLLIKFPVIDYKGNFIHIARNYQIEINQFLQRVLEGLNSDDIDVVVKWLEMFGGYSYSFKVPKEPAVVMDLIKQIERRITILEANPDMRLRTSLEGARITTWCFRTEYFDPFKPGKPFQTE